MRYYSLSRPISPGTFPSDTNITCLVNFESRKFIPEIDHEAWGFLECDGVLPESEVKAYELIPFDPFRAKFPRVVSSMKRYHMDKFRQKQIQKFLLQTNTTRAIITRDEVRWFDENGVCMKRKLAEL